MSVQRAQFRSLLDSCTNVFGTIKPDIRKRLVTAFDSPGEKTWDDAHCIIIGGQFITLWQAWIAIDHSAPRTGKRTTQNGKVLSGWSRVPTREEIYTAVEYAVNSNHSN